MLEAKIVLGEGLVISIASEFIENSGEAVRTDFQWITSIRLTKKNAEKTAEAGRKRWKIENEWFSLKAKGIRKKQKNISSELLESFGWLITGREDIFMSDMRCIPIA